MRRGCYLLRLLGLQLLSDMFANLVDLFHLLNRMRIQRGILQPGFADKK